MSLKRKILILVLLLSFLIIFAMSGTYYRLFIKQMEEHSHGQIAMAFEIIFDDLRTRSQDLSSKIERLIRSSIVAPLYVSQLIQEQYQELDREWSARELRRLMSSLSPIANELREFGEAIGALEILIYSRDRSLLALYERQAEKHLGGVYLARVFEQDLMVIEPGDEWFTRLKSLEEVPKQPLPANVSAKYQGEIPKKMNVSLRTFKEFVALQFLVPIIPRESVEGVCVINVGIKQSNVEQYSRLSKTKVNVFAGRFWSVGTLPAYRSIPENRLTTKRTFDFHDSSKNLPFSEITETTVAGAEYYQGMIAFGDEEQLTGAIAVFFPRILEDQGRKEFIVIVTIIIVLFGILSTIGASVLSAFITNPLVQLTRVADIIASGDFQQEITITSHDEIGNLANAIRHMKDRIHDVLQETQGLIHAVQNGDLNSRGDASVFTGDWQNLIIGINNVIDAFVEPLKVTAACIDQLSKSKIPEEITHEYLGDFNTIKQGLNILIRDITNVVNEIDELSQNVQNGELEARGQIELFGGGWQQLIISVNTLIEAFVIPINVTAEYVERIAQGDIPEKIMTEYRGNFNQIKQNVNMLIEAVDDISLLAKEMSEGNLTVDVNERSSRDILMQALNVMIQRLNEIVLNVKTVADSVAVGSQTMSSKAEVMSRGASQQSAAAEEASTSMEQMVANIRQNAENAAQTEKIAAKAAEDARNSGLAVEKTVLAMREITKKIGIIEEIARQTNILALNATIEAAKAQDYGKGFGIVASEVRLLSERSQEAAEEINELASSSVAIAEEAGAMLKRLVPDIQKTAELVQEISAASNEQKSGVEHINLAIQQLDHIIQQNTVTSEEIAATSEELASQADMLNRSMAFFNVDATREEETLDIE